MNKQNKNYIDECLEEFDEKFPTLFFYGEGSKEQKTNAEELSGKFAEDTKELPPKIKIFLKQKLQECERRKVEEIEKELNLNSKYTDDTTYGWIKLILTKLKN